MQSDQTKWRLPSPFPARQQFGLPGETLQVGQVVLAGRVGSRGPPDSNRGIREKVIGLNVIELGMVEIRKWVGLSLAGLPPAGSTPWGLGQAVDDDDILRAD